jgi:hypothetical protein
MDSSTAAAGAAYADTSQNSQISLGILEDKDDGECLGESQEVSLSVVICGMA